jgi:hypothetical protein
MESPYDLPRSSTLLLLHTLAAALLALLGLSPFSTASDLSKNLIDSSPFSIAS